MVLFIYYYYLFIYYYYLFSVSIKPSRHRFGLSLAWDWQFTKNMESKKDIITDAPFTAVGKAGQITDWD